MIKEVAEIVERMLKSEEDWHKITEIIDAMMRKKEQLGVRRRNQARTAAEQNE